MSAYRHIFLTHILQYNCTCCCRY